jgi:tetratricopeptide (TPR) repeat protein
MKNLRFNILYAIPVYLWCIFSNSIDLSAQNNQETILKAGKSYNAGDYSAAAKLYQSVADKGYESAGLYYNLGNAYFKQQDYPHAILYYERAKKLDPSGEDIDFNLNVANTRISDKIEPIPEMFYKRWYKAIVLLLPVDTWAILSVLSMFTAVAGFVIYLVTSVLFLRKAGFWTGIILTGFAFIILLLTWSSNRYLYSTNEGIVFAATLTVKSSPDENSTDLFVVHEGTKVLLMDNINGWYEIKIANGSVGWLPVSTLEKI